MGPRDRTRQEIIELLGRAAAEARQAEAWHAAAADPGEVEERHQAARDAAAMQLIELAGCAEAFTRDRGDPGTTLARFDDALEPVFEMRTALVHPEQDIMPPQLSPRRLAGMIGQLKTSLANLDSETRRLEPPAEARALSAIGIGLARIEKDGLPDPTALRARDLHYAGYYREIQFGRLAKASGLYDNFGKAQDPRLVDVNRSIYDADHMAHRFHEMRGGADKSILPVSVVAPEHAKRVPGRTLSELMHELRYEYQRPAERLAETVAISISQALEQYRGAVRGLARTYADITGDPTAAALIRDYVQRKEPRLEQDAIDAMGKALRIAAAPDGAYLAQPEAVRNSCLDLCFALEEQGDRRLIGILDAAEERAKERELDRDDEPELDRGDGIQRRRKRGRSL
jgi:hypothetical protein